MTEKLEGSLRWSSLATLAGLGPHYAWFYITDTPLLTDRIAEWIMARTPSRYAVWILDHLGNWGKPSALTGALAALGLALFLARLAGSASPPRARVPVTYAAGLLCAIASSFVFQYWFLGGLVSFWVPALSVAALCFWPKTVLKAEKPRRISAQQAKARATLKTAVSSRRALLANATRYGLPLVMGGGVVAVAAESYLREESLVRRAGNPVDLFPFSLPSDPFGQGLIRPPVTPLPQFYGMSKNTVDPVVDPRRWKLTISMDGRPVRRLDYSELLSMRDRKLRFVTLRCISNTLKSDLMGTAEWCGVHLSQLIDPQHIPAEMVEVAFVGVEGHDDSMSIDYAFSDECLLALGMNGKTLSRTHGFPIRLLAPRYYGCRNVKWIGEIRFVSRPYDGTWQRLGYTRDPRIHTSSHIDRMKRVDGRVRFGGVSFAGTRSIRSVRVRAHTNGVTCAWAPAAIEAPLSPFTWTRWVAEIDAPAGSILEANAQDGGGAWQELSEGNPFPTGLTGPTLARVNV